MAVAEHDRRRMQINCRSMGLREMVVEARFEALARIASTAVPVMAAIQTAACARPGLEP